jgi:hypothetical protein
MTCGAWLEHRAATAGLLGAQRRDQYRSAVAGAQGYLGGAARHATEIDPLSDAHEEATIAGLAAYCARNLPTEPRRAVDAFIDAHPAR